MSTEEIAAIGIALETDGVEKGIRALDVLASKGPAVEKSMGQVEGAAKRTGKSLETLGRGTALDGLAQTSATAAAGMEKMGAASGKAQSALSGQATAAKSAVSSFDSLKTAVSGFTQSESQYIQKLVDEAKQLGMTRAERERYIAQSRGMSESAQQVAAAVGAKIDAYKREQTELGKTAGATKDSTQSMLALARTGVAAFLGGAVVQGAMAASKAMFDASANAERLRTMLDFSTGGNSAREIEYLRGVTYRLGLEFSSTAKAYGQFRAAAKGTALEGDKARAVFESVAKASAVMGLSADQSSGVLLALQQMISKGTVQAEELRGQLGERLPGAFQIAAKAMGVTTAELGKMLEQGQVVADDFLPKFAKALEENLGGAAEKAAQRLDAAVNRFDNAWERLKQNAGDSGASEVFANGLSSGAGALDAMSIAMEQARRQGAGFWGQLGALSGAMYDLSVQSSRNLVNMHDNAEATKKAQEELARLQKIAATEGTSAWLLKEMGAVNRYIGTLQQARRERDALENGAGAAPNPNASPAEDARLARHTKEMQQRGKDQDAANTWRLNQSGVPPSYLKDMQELIRLNQAGVLVGKEYTDALAKQQAILLQKTGVTKNSAAAANAEQNAYESLIASIRAKIEEDRLELAGGAALTESQRLRIKLDQDLLAGRIKLGSAREAKVRAAIQEKAETEAQVAAMRALSKASLDAAQTREKYLTSLESGITKIRADITAQEEATARMGLSKEAIADLDAAKLDMLATDLELQAIKAMDRNLDDATYSALKQQAQAYRDLAKAKQGGAAKEAALDIEKASADAAKKAADDWAKASEQINNTLTDALMRGFESGKDFAKNMRDTVANMFKTLVLRPIISAVVNPVAGAITGAMGLSGAANAGQSALSTVGTGASIFNAGAGISGMAGGFANGLSAWGAGGSVTGVLSNPGLYTGAELLGAVAPILAGVALLASLIKKSTPHMGAASSYSEAGGLVSNADIYRASGLADTRTYNAEAAAVTGGVAKGIADTLNATARAFGKTAGYEITTAIADDKSKDGAWGALSIKLDGKSVLDWRDTQTSRWAPKEFADGEAGQKEYLAAVAKSTRDAMVQAIGGVDWATDLLQALGDSPTLEGLAQTVALIGEARAAFVGFGQYMPVFAAQSDAAVSAMVKASGGVQALAGGMTAFVDGFYTDAEKLAVNTDNVRAAIEKLGVAMPATGDEFKALVQSQIALGDAGAQTAAGLLAVSGAFDQLQDAAASLRLALGSAFDQLAQSLDDMRGDVTGADKRVADARMKIWEGYSAAQQRVIDLEREAAASTRAFAGSLREYVAGLSTGPDSSMGLDARYQLLQRQLQSTAALAAGGDQGARDRLTGVASSYLDAARERSRTSVDYARDESRVSVLLGKLATAAESDPLVQKYDAESLTIQQQIADAQVDVVKYLALMEATGTSTDLGIRTVDTTLAGLRDEYVSAAQAQAAANLKLDVALAALDALGLTEDLVNAIADNQTSSLSAALQISDEALASITGALGLTPENVAELGEQFGIEIALLVGQAATDLAATLQGALAFDPAQYDVLRGVLGYDPAIIAPLSTALGISPEAAQQLAGRIALQDGSAELLARVADGLPLSADAALALQTAAEGLGLTASTADMLGALRSGLGLDANAAALVGGVAFTDAAAAQVRALGAGVGLTQAAAAQVDALLGGLSLSSAASAQVDGLLSGLSLTATDRMAIEGMLRGIGFEPAAQEDVTRLVEGIGLRAGVLQSLSTALGLSPEAMAAIGVLSSAGSIDATVKSAYAMVGRSGFGSDVSQIDSEGYDYWRTQLATGATSMGDFQQRFLQDAAGAPDEALRAYIAPYMRKLGIPGFAVGTNYVPYDMVAQIHKGEAIVPAPFNPAAFQSGGNVEVVAELRRVTDRLEKVQAELATHKAELQSIKTSSSATATGMTGIVNKQVTLVTEAA